MFHLTTAEAAEVREAALALTEEKRKLALSGAVVTEAEEVVTWEAQPGSQIYFLGSPVFEVLYEGTRGPGKTDALLMDFAQHVGKGFGSEWRGILFRRTYPELEDVINKANKWYPLMFPGARYNKVARMWLFPTGEQLYFRHMSDPNDYWKYHGHAYPWIGFEEITTWPDPKCYLSMMSCCRSTMPGMPRKYRSTTNPYGVGHNWVKKRFRLHDPVRDVIKDSIGLDGKPEPWRQAIHGKLEENVILLTADPDYVQKIAASADNPNMLKAWLEGDWNIVAGGMFDDVWEEAVHAIPEFDIPKSWYVDRAFDWGSSKPFSVGWWAESDGSDVLLPNGKWMSTVPGDLFRIREWYGWNGRDDNVGVRMLSHEISKGIVEREIALGIRDRILPGPADHSIFNPSATESGISIAEEMAGPVTLDDGKQVMGVQFDASDKSPGSRKHGWQNIRKRLKASHKPKHGIREHPGLFVFRCCDQFLRTVPVLPRDDKDLDDVNTEAEDHIGDEVRYRCHNPPRVARSLQSRV